MASQKILDKSFKVNGRTVVINETVVKTLTVEDLHRERMAHNQRIEQIVAQMGQLKKQYDESLSAIIELDGMVEALPNLELPEVV